MVLVCCVCHRVKQDGDWVDKSVPEGELASHGYCPDCASIARVELALLRLKDLVRRQRENLPISAVA